MPEMSNNTIYMSLPAAQWFYMADDRLTALIVMPVNPRHTTAIAKDIRSEIDREWYGVLTWEDMLHDLLALMQFDMAGSMVMMGILYIVITFGLFGTILTMMIERQREFGMLISLGMKRSRLALMVFLESLFISISGIISGILVSIPIVLYFYHHPIPLTGEMAGTMMEYGFEPVMPFSANPVLFLKQARIVLVIAFIVGLYPIKKVYQLDIMKAKN
jgi:putative ABC transport system permease protein